MEIIFLYLTDKKTIAQQWFASMATSGFSYGKSATKWNVLLYL